MLQFYIENSVKYSAVFQELLYFAFRVVAGDCRIDQLLRLNFRVLLLQINIYDLFADVLAYRVPYFKHNSAAIYSSVSLLVQIET
jgi:hypothetical protein